MLTPQARLTRIRRILTSTRTVEFAMATMQHGGLSGPPDTDPLWSLL
jgi:hypothetical protein